MANVKIGKAKAVPHKFRNRFLREGGGVSVNNSSSSSSSSGQGKAPAVTSLAASKVTVDSMEGMAATNAQLAIENLNGRIWDAFTPQDECVEVESNGTVLANIPAAKPSAAGVMTADDKSKLDGIEEGAQVNPTSLPANGGNADTVDNYHASDFPQVNGTLTPPMSWDDADKAGYYKVQYDGVTTGWKNAPSLYLFGMLEVVRLQDSTSSDSELRVLQVYYPHNVYLSSNYGCAVRMRNGSDKIWNEWAYIPTSAGNIASATKATQDGDGNVISSTYLPLSGGTMTGTITSSANRIILATNNISFDTSALDNKGFCFDANNKTLRVSGTLNGKISLGLDACRWNNLYLSGNCYAGTYYNSSGTEVSYSGHTHTKSEITDFPSSFPANGGNSDTVDNYHASDFIYREYIGYTRGDLHHVKFATASISGWTWNSASIVLELFSNGYGGGICFLGKVEIIVGCWDEAGSSLRVDVRWIVKGAQCNDDKITVVKDLDNKNIDVYLNNNIWDCSLYVNVVDNYGFVINSDRSVVSLPTASETVILYSPANATYVGNLTGNADTATKATQDADGNVISATYGKKGVDIIDNTDCDDSNVYLTTGTSYKQVASIGSATTSDAGVMSAKDKSDLDTIKKAYDGSIENAGLNAYAEETQVKVSLEDAFTVASQDITATISSATTSDAGVMSAADKQKLDAWTTGLTFDKASTVGELTIFSNIYITSGMQIIVDITNDPSDCCICFDGVAWSVAISKAGTYILRLDDVGLDEGIYSIKLIGYQQEMKGTIWIR